MSVQISSHFGDGVALSDIPFDARFAHMFEL